MKQTLTIDLVSRFEVIKKEFLAIQDEGTKKELVLNICKEVSGKYDHRVAANTMNLLNYYVSAGRIEIDGLIQFLSTNKDIDYQTVLREEKDGFDREFGTTTSLILRQYELPEIVPLHRFQTSGRCHPSPVTSVKMALKELKRYNVQYERFIFIDVGAGLGRNLLLAADYPFKKIIGIEHSQYLHDLTKNNIKIYEDRMKRKYPFELQCIDALEYSFPEEDLVFYFWRPFTDEIAVEFVKKLESFIKNTSYQVILVFLGVVYPAVKNSAYLDIVDVFFTPDLIDNEDQHFPISVYSNKGYNAEPGAVN